MMNVKHMTAALAVVSVVALWAVNGLGANGDAGGGGDVAKMATTTSVPASPAVPPSAFSFELPKAGLTSVGVFDEGGRLVRTLWQLTSRPAGKQAGEWDGMTDMGEAAPAGAYEVRVVLNNSEYRNVGVIGNTADPPGEPHNIR